MEIVVNDNNEITTYVLIGSLDNSQAYGGTLPTDFFKKFKPKHYLLQDNEIVVNQNYEEPTISIPTPEPSGPSPEMLAINALGIQLAKHLAGGD